MPFLPPRDLPEPAIEPASPASPALQVDSLPLSHWGSPSYVQSMCQFLSFIYLATPGLCCGMWGLVSRPGMEPWPPALGAWSLSQWTSGKSLCAIHANSKAHPFNSLLPPPRIIFKKEFQAIMFRKLILRVKTITEVKSSQTS